jgi:hypothetical protein
MRQGPHPVRFFLLILPYGAAFGYVTVALQWLAVHRSHIDPKDFAVVIAAAFGVHGVKVLWAPVVDAVLSKRVWYVLALALTMAGVMASAAWNLNTESLRGFTWVVMASQLGLTLMGMACENLLGALPAEEKGTASGWYQAGNFLGMGLGGGLALHLATVLPQSWMAGAVLCAVMAPCGLALIGMPEPARHATGLVASGVQLFWDVVGLVVEKIDGRWLLSVAGISGLLIAFSPIGSGAAGNFWPSAADAWHASAAHVEAISGWLGGVVGAAGAALGGWFAARMPKRNAYALGGALTAVSGLLLAIAPRAPWAFDVGTLLYQLFNGVAFAAFTAFVLESIGKGAVATKYNVFAGLANLAIAYMTRVNGSALSRHGATGMLVTDALCTCAGIGALFAIVAVMRRLAPKPAMAPSAAA